MELRLVLLLALCLGGVCFDNQAVAVVGEVPLKDRPMEGEEGDWYGNAGSASALGGMVRCHKCLFGDQNIRNGDVSLLLRGADSHHRYLTPLELASNGHNLPGRDTADLFYHHNQAALELASKGLDKVAGEVSDVSAVVLADLSRFQRLLQYSIAANATDNWLRNDAWDYNVALYRAANVDVEHLIQGIEKIREYYQGLVNNNQRWQSDADAQFNHLLQRLRSVKQTVAAPNAQFSAPMQLHGTGALRQNGRPLNLESPSEVPFRSLLLDPRTVNPESLPESERGTFSEVLKSWQEWETKSRNGV